MIGIGAAALGLMAVTLVVSLSEVAADRSPATAVRINPFNARALSNAAMLRIQSEGQRGAGQAQASSERAIRLNPVSAAGVTNLGYLADLRGDHQQAAVLMAHAERLSRRDVMAQVWLIQQRVGAGDVAGALRHYDIALKTSKVGHALLMPILVQASGVVDVQVPLARLLATRPVWRKDYVRAVISDPGAHSSMVRMSLLLDKLNSPLSDQEKGELALNLVSAGRFAEAGELYGRSKNGQLLLNGDFSGPSGDNPFYWFLSESYEYGAAKSSGGLSIFARGERGGQVARQLLILPVGRYRLDSVAGGGPVPRDATPYWQVSCAKGGAISGNIEVALTGPNARSTGTFDVPTGCSAQWLILYTRPIVRPPGYEAQISRVAISRIG